MANHERHSVAQPASYKKFNEVGTGEDKFDNLDTEGLPLQMQSDANGAQNGQETITSSAKTKNYNEDMIDIHVNHDEDEFLIAL